MQRIWEELPNPEQLVMAALRGHVSAAERAEIQAFLEEGEQ